MAENARKELVRLLNQALRLEHEAMTQSRIQAKVQYRRMLMPYETWYLPVFTSWLWQYLKDGENYTASTKRH